MPRLKFLDGLRGWAAVFVLLYHVFSDGLPVGPSGSYLPLFLPFSGYIAVLVFFIVSGFSLTVRYLDDGDIRPLLRTAAGRYFRLAIPIFAACFFVNLAMASGFWAEPADRLEKFRGFLTFAPTIDHLFKFSFYSVFFDYRPADTYIGPLWTMSIELAGSLAVLLAAVLVRPFASRLLILVGLALVAFYILPTGSWIWLFFVGAALADCFNRGFLVLPRWLGISVLIAGCLSPALLSDPWLAIGPLLIVIGSAAVPEVEQFLSGKLSAHLARLTFPLYLVHGPVLVFVGEPLTRHFGTGPLERFLIDLCVCALSFVMARGFVPLNDFAIGVSRAVGNKLVRASVRFPASSAQAP